MKVKILCLCLLLSLVLFICGCAKTLKTGSPFKVRTPTYDAIVYFYRPAMFSASLASPRVLDNGLYVFDLVNGKYIEYVVNPGKHEFRTDTLNIDEPLTFEIKLGEVYFLRMDFRRGAFMCRWLFTRVYPEQALEEIRYCDKQKRRYIKPSL